MSTNSKRTSKQKPNRPPVDIQFDRHGSLTLVQPMTESAQEWVDTNVQVEGWQWMGPRFAVDPRAAYDLATIADEEGLVIGWA